MTPFKMFRTTSCVTRAFRSKHWENHPYQVNVSAAVSDRERMDSIASYYGQSAVDVAAAKKIVRLKAETLLYTGKSQDGSHILRSAQYLVQELPVRLAHQVLNFRSLPFIIGCNPTLLSIHDLYLKAFMRLTKFTSIKTREDEERFSEFSKCSLDRLSGVLGMLAKGFSECDKQIQDPQFVKTFLDKILTFRLGIRLLTEHHLALKAERPNYVGIINRHMSLTDVVEKQVKIVEEMFELQYGVAPEVVIAGQTKLVFPYIPSPLEYILLELLKNAFRATVESRMCGNSQVPPIYLTLASDGTDFWIRISDHGGGVPADMEEAMWNYNISTPSKAAVESGWVAVHSAGVAHSGSPVEREPYFVTPPPTSSRGPLDEHIRLRSADASDVDAIRLPPPAPHAVANDCDGYSQNNQHVFANLTQHAVAQSIHGYGFGLPTSRAYARYLGGDVSIQTIRGVGTDCYLRLRHIDAKDSFRI